MTTYWCEYAWLASGPVHHVLVDVDDGVITNVTRCDDPPRHARRLWGLTLPGLANVHSHAFHRALRGRTGGGRGTFWTWREQMYEVATRLDPDSYYRLALGVYAEMALAGITCVGEFHYLHHAPDGSRYTDPNAMSAALVQAASDAGIRLTLLDTCYLDGGFGKPVDGVQRRYADTDVHAWRSRVDDCTVDPDRVRLAAALHSVRAVPVPAIPEVLGFARDNDAPLHVHLSEQRGENDACLAAHGRTPTQLLDEHGVLGAGTTAVHATHLTAGDVARLGGSGTGVCLCPTTEADLADGIGPADALAVAGSPLSLGSDGQSVIDPFAEAQAVESSMRLASENRGHFSSTELLTMATTSGHRALGWPDAGGIAVGARGDLVTVDLTTPRLAGVPPSTAATAATADDVREVISDGRWIVHQGVHRTVLDVGKQLRDAIDEVL